MQPIYNKPRHVILNGMKDLTLAVWFTLEISCARLPCERSLAFARDDSQGSSDATDRNFW